ncbi:Growth hormone-regulated TBC protein 1 [Echinococcus granulosus]|nr:Growth hormone-regulated TBC protein 1 [Echinococcus granulosus]
MQNYGFESPDFVSKEVYEDFRKSYQVVLERRCARWKTVIDQGDLVRDYQLKRFCRKGVPAQFRSHVWMTLSGAYEMMQQNPKVYQTAAAAQPPKTTFTTIMAVHCFSLQIFPEHSQRTCIFHKPKAKATNYRLFNESLRLSP